MMKIFFLNKIQLFNKVNKKSGFSTLLIVMILGGVALSLTLMLSTSTLWSIRGGLDSKVSTGVRSLASACAEIALETIRENNSYTGNDTVLLNGNSCSYTVSNTGGSNRLLNISSTVSGITRYVNITTSAFNPLVISSWEEVQ